MSAWPENPSDGALIPRFDQGRRGIRPYPITPGRRCAPPILPATRAERGTNGVTGAHVGFVPRSIARNGDHGGAQRRPTRYRLRPLVTTNVPAMPFDFVDFDVRIAEKPRKFYRVRQP